MALQQFSKSAELTLSFLLCQLMRQAQLLKDFSGLQVFQILDRRLFLQSTCLVCVFRAHLEQMESRLGFGDLL